RFDSGVTSVRNRTPRFSGGAFPALPPSSFYDVNGRLEVKPTVADRVSVSVYDSRDDANRSQDIALPAPTAGASTSTTFVVPDPQQLPSDAAFQVSDVARWKGRGMSAMWERQWTPSASTAVSIGRSEFSSVNDRASILTSPSTGMDYSFFAGRGGSSGLA